MDEIKAVTTNNAPVGRRGADQSRLLLKYGDCKSIEYNPNMKSLDEIQKTLREQSPYLAKEFGVRIVGVFGSYVRQEQHPDSDLDLLIELDRPPKISLIGLVELENELSHILGVKVDLAIKANLKKHIGRRILDEVVPI